MTNEPASLPAMFRLVWRRLSPGRRKSALSVMALVVLSGFAEIISIGAVIPFLTFLTGLQSNSLPPWLASRVDQSGLDAGQLAIAAAIALAAAAIIAGLIRLLFVWRSQRFVFGASYDISVMLYDTTLRLPYPVHTARNTAEVLGDLNKAQILAGGLFMPVVQALGSAVIALFVIAVLLMIDARVAIGAGLGFALVYALVVLATRGILARNSVTVARAWSARIKTANEGLGGIRDIILDQTHDAFAARFRTVEKQLERAQLMNYFLGAAPRFVVEALGIVLFAGIALALTFQPGGLLASLPVLGAIALGAQRLLPLLQSIYAGWAAMATGREMLSDLVRTLEIETPRLPSAASSQFETQAANIIVMDDVGFAYPGSDKPALRNVDLTIRAGDRIGIVGRSGSGKSTLMDLLLGLQSPTAGRMTCAGKPLDAANMNGWRSQVAHVPQAIFLADGSIAENIAFGVPADRIDRKRLEDAARQSQVWEFADALPDGLDTVVGERGARLSGGQRQRIGIARALYKQARFLVLDEATSALDSETEEEVNRALAALDRRLTIVVISHRHNSLATCDRWLVVERGEVREVGKEEAGSQISGLGK